MTRWLEERLGATIPLEVVFRFRRKVETTSVDRMRLVAAIQTQLLAPAGGKRMPFGGHFCPARSQPASRRECRPAGGHQFEAQEPLRHPTAITAGSPRTAARRCGGSASVFAESMIWTTAAFVTAMRSDIQPILDEQLGADRGDVDLVITGTAPIVFKARQSLLDGMLFGLGHRRGADRRRRASC